MNEGEEITLPSEELQSARVAIDQKLKAIFESKATSNAIEETAALIVNKINPFSPNAQLELIRKIDEYFQHNKYFAAQNGNDQIFETLGKLKIQIIHQCGKTGEYSNWKDALLGIHYQPISRTFLQQKLVYPDANNPISLADKDRFTGVKRKNICAVSGSSFATNKQNILAHAHDESSQLKPEPILDGSYSASTQDGWVMAVGDGCGHGEDLENDDIGRSAYFAAKDACRLMAGYPDADRLGQGLSQLAKQVSADLIVKVRAHRNQPLEPIKKKGEDLKKTTLVCARAFKTDDTHFRLVGFNIGDTMLISYNPTTGQFDTIARARQIVRGFGNGSPASLPDLYSDEQMVVFDVTVPRGSVVFGLTDGVWDYLPVRQNSTAEQEQTNYIDTEIDFDTLRNDEDFKFPESVNVSTLTQAIARYAVAKTEMNRKQCLTAAQQGAAIRPSLEQEINDLQAQEKQKNDPEVQGKINQLEKAVRDQQFQLGDDFTLLGMQLDQIDLNPDYTTTEKVVSGLTLGLYALIRDCLHLRDDEKVTLGDVGKTALAVFGFFATGTLAGLGYLAYKGIHAASSEDEQSDYRIDLKS